MDEFDIPIFKKTYELYKTLHECRGNVPKQDRYTVWQRNEDSVLELLKLLLEASNLSKDTKLPTLEQASRKLNLLRILLRLAKDVRTIDNKKYIALESTVDEIGRMLGGWIRSLRVK